MDKKKEEISLHTKEVEQMIEKYLPKEEGFQKKVIEAMNYSFLAGGKRLRPMLMLETYRLFGGKGKVIEPFMAAIEMIHTYSLVHDDLPAMDNDAMRRGKPTTHKAFGEAMAILAGELRLRDRSFGIPDGTAERAGWRSVCGTCEKSRDLWNGGRTDCGCPDRQR